MAKAKELLEITDCRGNKKMALLVDFMPTLTKAGFVEISDQVYLVQLQGSYDDMEFSKEDGTAYQVTCWANKPGGRACTCDDFQFHGGGRRGLRACKHIQAAFQIKAKAEAGTWER